MNTHLQADDMAGIDDREGRSVSISNRFTLPGNSQVEDFYESDA